MTGLTQSRVTFSAIKAILSRVYNHTVYFNISYYFNRLISRIYGYKKTYLSMNIMGLASVVGTQLSTDTSEEPFNL